MTVVGVLELGRGHEPDLSVQAPVIEPVDVTEATAISRSSIDCQGPLLGISSALNRELNASARALSYQSPVDPTEATAPANRWV